jgi:hypothetical protein
VAQQQGGGRLGTDPACAGEVVRRVAAQRDQVRDLRRQHAITFDHTLRVDALELGDALRRPQHVHVRRDDLVGIAVGRQDEGVAAARLLPLRERREDVVGLEAGRAGRRDPEGREERRQLVELLDDLVVERVTPALVAGHELVAVAALAAVERHDHGSRRGRVVDREEHVREAEQRIHGTPTGSLDGRHRVVGPVHQRVAVDDQERARHEPYNTSL